MIPRITPPPPPPAAVPLPSKAGEELTISDPERALAVAYAPASVRPALTALFALDERLGAIVAATTEPTIGLIRLAWWREALERLDHAPPPAEPLLAAIAAHCLPGGVTGASLAAIEDGWAALLDDEPDGTAITRHGRARGGGLFTAAATMLTHRHAELVSVSTSKPIPALGRGWTLKQVQGDGPLGLAGAAWALADLGHRHSSADVRGEARAQARVALDRLPKTRWPKPLRPLGVLAALARRDASAKSRAQGSPARLLRMLALRLTGL